MADRGEHVEQLAVILLRIAHAVGRNHRQAQALRYAKQRLVAALLFALLVPLQFEIHIAAPVNRRQPLGDLPRLAFSAARERRRQRSLLAACQADQSGGKFFQVLNRRRALGLRRLAHFEARDQLA